MTERSDFSLHEGHPLVSIIIPFFWKRSNFLRQFLESAAVLQYDNFEILVVSNRNLELALPPNAKVIMTDTISQGDKLDIGISNAKGSICSLVGDDTYPAQNWLRNAVRYFNDPEVVAVGGPGLTPPDDSPLQKASGFVYESIFAAGPTRFRHSVGKARECDDLPATNLFVRKEAVTAVGGIGLPFRSGEDTYLCSKLRTLKKKMIYAPDVIVYHHRRTLLRGYLRQIWNVGLHRAYFARVFGSTSRRLTYFIPMLMTLLLPFVLYAMVVTPPLGLVVIALVLIISVEEGLRFYAKVRSAYAALLVPLGIWLTFVTYGIAFMRGLLLSKDHPTLFHRE